MKIVVEVSEKDYLNFMLQYDSGVLDEKTPSHRAKIAIANGQILPKGHGRLIDADKLIKDNGLDNATKYGNKTKEELDFSYDTMMMYEIFDLIDDAEVVVEADKEGAEE